MPKVYQVIAHLPASVELAKRKAKGTLTVEVNGGSKPGKLILSKGTVEWWPDGTSANTYRENWDRFAEICEKNLKKRRGRKPRTK
jgi:hypothetical protein